MITNLDDVRKLTSGNCKELEQFVANIKGRIPIFGYPMMCYSPPDTGLTLTDRKTWRVALLSDGKIVKEEKSQDVETIIVDMNRAKAKSP